MRRRADRETLVFAAATAAALIHALDDAFVHRGTGLGLGVHAVAGVLAIAVSVAGVAAFPRLRPGLRAATAFGFGALATVNGAMHAVHVARYEATGGDITGVLALVAGVVLLGLAAAVPWRHRGEATVSARRRWAIRAVTPFAAVLGAVVVLGPVLMAIGSTHKWREPAGPPPGPAYAQVAFRASDGLRLRGWYVPSRNGAAIVVVHGGGSDRRGGVTHARMLARHGYGVLLYDARGRGESEGSPNDYGWGWPKDVAGALAFLHHRPDVDPRRIGALGLSTGADVLIEAAAKRRDIRALVTDGAAAGSFEDWHHLRGTELGTAPGWVMFSAMRVLSSDGPGRPLEDLVPRIAAPTLLVSAGTDVERDFNRLYERAAGGRAAHWNVARAKHTRAVRQFPALYERRVLGFLDRALAVGRRARAGPEPVK